MVRSIVSILTALFSAVIVIFLIELVGQKKYPPPPGLNPEDSLAMEPWMNSLPLAGLIFILIAWFTGAYTGGIIVSALDKLNAFRSSLTVGLLLLISTLINLSHYPHPFWMWIFGILAIITGTWLGYKTGLYLDKRKSAVV